MPSRKSVRYCTMSDFFSGLRGGFQQPDVVMNSGPLPPTNSAGMPPGFNGVPDGIIDMADNLLGDLQPYAYGKPARPGSQAGYQNIPHAVARIIPAIQLPELLHHGGEVSCLLHIINSCLRCGWSWARNTDCKFTTLRVAGMVHTRTPGGRR